MMIRNLSEMMKRVEGETHRRIWIFATLGALLLYARLALDLRHAELWGDDGWTFYPDAYNSGLRCLLWPVSGYLNTSQRLGALFTVWLHVPMTWVPVLFASLGLASQLIVAVFFVTDRLGPLWPEWRSRAAFATLYLALPNSFEVLGTLTNTQWHLQLLAFLIVVAPPQPRRGWHIFDAAFLLISGVSGPFGMILLPLSLYMVYHYRGEARSTEGLRKAVLLAGCVAVQFYFLLRFHDVRHVGPLGANLLTLLRMVALQVVVGLLLGLRTMSAITNSAAWQHHNWPWILIALLYASICVIAFVRGNLLFRAFCVFGGLLFAAEMSSPVITLNAPQWPAMCAPLIGQRYFLAPMLILAGALFTLAARRSKLLTSLSIASLVLIALWAVPHDFFYLNVGHTNFHTFAVTFDAAPPGTRVEFPTRFHSGKMVLVKKGSL